MTSEELAETVVKCGEAAMRWAEAAEDPDDPEAARWMQTKMLAEIAFQLAVANERADDAGRKTWPPPYLEKDAAKL